MAELKISQNDEWHLKVVEPFGRGVGVGLFFKFGFGGLSEAAPAKELEGLGQSLLSREQLPSQGRGERNFGV